MKMYLLSLLFLMSCGDNKNEAESVEAPAEVVDKDEAIVFQTNGIAQSDAGDIGVSVALENEEDGDVHPDSTKSILSVNDARVGKFVNISRGTYCTAFLIASQKIAVTAKHCWDNPDQFEIYWGMSSESRFIYKTPINGWSHATWCGDKTLANDWVVFKLRTDVPAGYFGYKVYHVDTTWKALRFGWKTAWFIAYGRESRFAQYRRDDVEFSFAGAYPLFPAIVSKQHAGMPGSSGGPLLEAEGYVVGSANGSVDAHPVYSYRYTPARKFIQAVQGYR